MFEQFMEGQSDERCVAGVLGYLRIAKVFAAFTTYRQRSMLYTRRPGIGPVSRAKLRNYHVFSL